MIKSASRRAFLYWLLLLIPTLAAGAGALWLLSREQMRIDEQAQAALETRKTAVADRARLIAENIEVLVADVQNGLMTTLREAPSDGPAVFLTNWKNSNPLVSNVFQSTNNGLIRWGITDLTIADWAMTTPWLSDKATAVLPQDKKQSKEINDASEVIPEQSPLAELSEENDRVKALESNVSQYQNQRAQIQTLSSINRTVPEYEAESRLPSQLSITASTLDTKTTPLADLSPQETSHTARRGSGELGGTGTLSGSSARSYSDASQTEIAALTKKETAPSHAPKASLAVPKDIVKEKQDMDVFLQQQPVSDSSTGWTPWIDGQSQLHLFGWRLCGNGTVLVVEVNLDSLAAQLSPVLPQTIPANEAYALRLSDGTTVHQVGFWSNPSGQQKNRLSAKIASPDDTGNTFSVPLSRQVLPGWTIAAAFINDASRSSGKNFFLASTTLVVIFVLTILSGGALLLRQTRISENDAFQKTTFVANVSHELKTPLTTIRLHAELLEQDRVRNPEQRNTLLQAISRESQRLTRLVNNILDFSRLEQGRRKLNKRSVDASAELNQLLDYHEPRINGAGLELRRHFPDNPVPFHTDPDALGQIILNLIDNACKYAASGKQLDLDLNAEKDGSVRVTVADRGPGIPPSHRKHIFEKFHRVDDTLTAEQSGVGLGLSIARQLARALGGDLRYQSRDGGGSEFILTLQQ